MTAGTVGEALVVGSMFSGSTPAVLSNAVAFRAVDRHPRATIKSAMCCRCSVGVDPHTIQRLLNKLSTSMHWNGSIPAGKCSNSAYTALVVRDRDTILHSRFASERNLKRACTPLIFIICNSLLVRILKAIGSAPGQSPGSACADGAS